MNRLDARPLPLVSQPVSPPSNKSTPAPLAELFTDGVAASAAAAGVAEHPGAAAATFAPVHYEQGYAYPLLVWLHGDGQTERDLPTVMTHVSLRNYVAVAPRGDQSNGAACHPAAGGEPCWRDSENALSDADERVAAAIDLAAERFNIRHDRVFLAGVGTGGTAALRIGLANPRRFAGVASFDGPMPSGGQPLRSVNRVRRLPLLLASSQESVGYPQDRVCRDLRLLHTAGCKLSIRQYPGSDDLTTTMLADLDRWMMELVCQGR